MILRNPFFVILILFMVTSLWWTYANDGEVMPQRRYNVFSTFIGIVINFFLIYGAVMWAATH